MSRLSRFIHFYTDEDDGNGREEPYILKTITGSLLHITDALAKPAKKFVATLEPIQDLHGQDAPYPSGGGKNLLPMTVDNLKLVNTSGTWSGNIYTLNSATFTLNTDNGGNVESITVGGTASARSVFLLWSDYEYVADLGLDGRYYISGCPSGGSGSTYSLTLQAYGSGNISDTGSGVAFNTSDLSNQKYRMIIDVRSGSPTSTLVFKPLFCLDSVSDKSFSPYSNICPITGHTGANVTRTGKNWFDKNSQDNVLNRYLNVANGTLVQSSSGYDTSGFINSKPSVTYTLSGISTTGVLEYCFYDSNKTFISGIASSARTFTTPQNTAYVRIDYKHIDLDSLQLELSSTASTYEEYKGQTIPITFPVAAGTVYGAKLINDGTETWKLRVDKAKFIVDGGNNLKVNYAYPNKSVFNFASNTSGLLPTGVSSTINAISDTILNMSDNAAYVGTIDGFSTGDTGSFRKLSMPSTGITTVADMNAYLAENPITIIAPLVTPIEYTLTESQALTLLKGENNIWVDDSDSLELTYYAKAEETTP